MTRSQLVVPIGTEGREIERRVEAAVLEVGASILRAQELLRKIDEEEAKRRSGQHKG